MIVSKNFYLSQMPFKLDRKEAIVSVTTLVFTGYVEVCLPRFQWIPGLSHHTVYGGLIIYILTLAALNI